MFTVLFRLGEYPLREHHFTHPLSHSLSHHVSDIGTDAQEKCARQRPSNLAVISNAYLTPKQPLVSDRVSELVFQKVLDIIH